MRRWLLLSLLLASAPAWGGEPVAGDPDEPADDEPADDEPADDEPADDDDSAAPATPAAPGSPAAEASPPSRTAEQPVVREQIVVTATGEPRVLSKSPISVRVIDRQAITRTTATDAAELMRRAPGVPVMSHGADDRGGVSGLSLQGLPAGRTLVLIDGRPLLGDTGGIVDLAQIPVAQIERVEIVQGPMSALYGSEALGGVVNLVTRAPGGGGSLEGRIQGATDRSIDGAATLTGAEGPVSGSITATGRHHAARDLDPSEPSTDLDRRTTFGARGRLRLDLGRSATELTTSVSHDQREGLLDRSRAVSGSPVELWATPKRNVRFQAALSERVELADWGSLTVRADGTAWLATFDQVLQASPVHYDRRTSLWAMLPRVRLDLRALPWLTGSVGVDGRVEELVVTQDRIEPGGAKVQRLEVPRVRSGSVEPFAQADVRLLGDRLELVPGVRLSIHDAYGVTAAPSLAVRVSLWRGASLRASGARGYRAPTLKDRYLLFDHTALGYVVIGQPDLRPESSWGVNLSLDQRFGTVASLRVGGFAHHLQDRITQVLDSTAGQGDYEGLNVFVTTNVAGGRSVGAEVTGELDLQVVRATAAWRFVWAWDDDGFFLPDVPVHALRGTVEVPVAVIGLSVYTSAGWESERFVDSGQRLRSPGMVLWDLRVEQQLPLRQELAWYVGVDNLLDQHRDPNREGDFRPVTGRRLVVGLRGALRLPGPAGRPGSP